MPFDINSDPRLRNTWNTIQNLINDLQRYRHIKLRNIMIDHNVSLYEAKEILDKKIKILTIERRKEMKQIQQDIIQENKYKQQAEEKIKQEEEQLRQERLEQQRQAKNEKKKAELEKPPTLRRSNRIQKSMQKIDYTY